MVVVCPSVTSGAGPSNRACSVRGITIAVGVIETRHSHAGASFNVQFECHVVLLRAQVRRCVCGRLRCGRQWQLELRRCAAHASATSRWCDHKFINQLK